MVVIESDPFWHGFHEILRIRLIFSMRSQAHGASSCTRHKKSRMQLEDCECFNYFSKESDTAIRMELLSDYLVPEIYVVSTPSSTPMLLRHPPTSTLLRRRRKEGVLDLVQVLRRIFASHAEHLGRPVRVRRHEDPRGRDPPPLPDLQHLVRMGRVYDGVIVGQPAVNESLATVSRHQRVRVQRHMTRREHTVDHVFVVVPGRDHVVLQRWHLRSSQLASQQQNEPMRIHIYISPHTQ